MKIKKLGNYAFSANYIYDSHRHDEFEINYINFGSCMMTINHENAVLHKGDCILILPQFKHSFMVSGEQECQITQFEFSADDFAQDIAEHFPNEKHFLKMSNCSDVLESISKLYGYKNKSDSCDYYGELFLLELQKLQVLLKIHLKEDQQAFYACEIEPLHTMLKYIDTHYEQTFSLDSLAKSNGISPRYLRKIFVKHMGICAIDYITMLRMEKAKDMLKNSKHTISSISLEVGYNSFQYFSMLFKKKIGVTPTAFRQQYQL